MTYRNDLDAAHARITELEYEIAQLQEEKIASNPDLSVEAEESLETLPAPMPHLNAPKRTARKDESRGGYMFLVDRVKRMSKRTVFGVSVFIGVFGAAWSVSGIHSCHIEDAKRQKVESAKRDAIRAKYDKAARAMCDKTAPGKAIAIRRLTPWVSSEWQTYKCIPRFGNAFKVRLTPQDIK